MGGARSSASTSCLICIRLRMCTYSGLPPKVGRVGWNLSLLPSMRPRVPGLSRCSLPQPTASSMCRPSVGSAQVRSAHVEDERCLTAPSIEGAFHRRGLLRVGLLSALMWCGGGSGRASRAVVEANHESVRGHHGGKEQTQAPLQSSREREGRGTSVSKAAMAGLITGSSSKAVKTLLLLPLDTIRVRQQKAAASRAQAQEAVVPNAASASPFTPVLAVADLYRGWLPALLLAGPSTAAFFGMNEFALSELTAFFPPAMAVSLAAVAASIASWTVRTPFEVLKVALMGNQYDTVPAAIRGLGVLGLWRRLPDYLLMYLPGDPIKLGVYSALGQSWQVAQGGRILLWQESLDGAVATALVTLLSNPLSVANTRLILNKANAGAGAGEESTNIIAALRDLVQREGVGVFGCGLWPRLLKGAASGAITFTIFEVSRNLLS